jgi:hypothetical protein
MFTRLHPCYWLHTYTYLVHNTDNSPYEQIEGSQATGQYTIWCMLYIVIRKNKQIEIDNIKNEING